MECSGHWDTVRGDPLALSVWGLDARLRRNRAAALVTFSVPSTWRCEACSMSDEDPWDRLNLRYANDDIARFTLILDGVEDAAARLRSENIADLRLALVIADYLTDVILARRVARLIALSERGFAWESREQFDSKARGLLRQGFNRRVTLAARPYDAGFTFGLGDPIVDLADAEVLRVAHAYRNDVYHADRHPSTIRTIASAALHALVRAWKASLSARTASSWGADSPLMRRLERIGYVSPDFAGKGYLSLHAGAAAVASWLEAAVPFNLREQRRELATDIEARVRWSESMVEWLSSRQGPGREHIEPALRWTDFWRQHGDDPELIALDAQRRSAFDQARDEDANDHWREQIRQCEDAYVARLRHLRHAHQPSVLLDGLPALGRRGRGLRQAKHIGALLSRYRTLDMELGVFEEVLADAATGWDEYVQSEVDRARGKTPAISWTDGDGGEHTVYLD